MTYICDKCNSSFIRKYNLKRHLNRKLSCIKTLPTCDICLKTFKTNRGLTRHLNRLVPCVMSNKNEVGLLKNKVKELEDKLNNMSSNSMVNHGTINNTDNSTNTINIVLPFGEENTKYVTKAQLSKIINHCNNSFRYLGEHIHFNKDHPENQNIRIQDKDVNYNRVELHDGNQWNTHNRKLTIPKYLGCLYDTLEELYEQFEPQLGERERRNFRTITKVYYNKNNSYQEKINTILDGLKELLVNRNIHRVEY
jgi:hypothetical protein